MNINPIKISKSTILFVYIYIISCINLPYVSAYSKIKYVLIVVIGIIIAKKIPMFFEKKYLVINYIMIIFCGSVILSAIVNRGNSFLRNTFWASIVFVAICMETLFVMEYIAEKKRIFEMIKLCYIMTLLIVLFTDIIAVTIPDLFGNEGIAMRYLVGTKFNVMYLHLQLIVLYLVKTQPFKYLKIVPMVILLIYIGLTLWISRLVDCNTGLIGCMLLFAVLLLAKKRYGMFSSPQFFVATILLCCSFAFFYEVFLRNIFVQDIVSNILGRSLTLTGRTNIYALLPFVLSKHIFFGYGYGSAYEVSMSSFGYANTQNGLAQWIINVGGVGTIALLIWFYSVLREWNKKAEIKQRYLPIVVLLYVFSILSAVEITIDLTYIFWVAFIAGVTMEKDNSLE